jgi:hypothetical protein
MHMLVALTTLLALLSLLLLIGGAYAIRRRRFLGMATSWTFALLLFVAAALCATLGVATQGYRAFLREEIAAVVDVEPTGEQSFAAVFHFLDGRRASFSLLGDALYVDAHILKWKPTANLLGLHTAYELGRVAGRYAELDHEQTRPRTVFSLAAGKPLDIFDLRQRFALLSFFVDAEYGSATFIIADRPATFEVRVSTTGLLIRRRV